MKATRCHRYLVGLEDAESQAERERSLGWEVGVLDPGVDPEDYHWRVAGDDVLVYAVEPIAADYMQALGVTLLTEGAHIIGIYDQQGECPFWRSPRRKNPSGSKVEPLVAPKEVTPDGAEQFSAYSEALGRSGISIQQPSNYQKLDAIPEEEFEKTVNTPPLENAQLMNRSSVRRR